MARTRLYSTLIPPGTADRVSNGVSITHLDSVSRYPNGRWIENVCIDELGKDSDHPLTINKLDRRGVQTLNGRIDIAPTSYRQFLNWTPGAQAADVFHASHSLPSVGTVATAALARSNPSRATLSVPNFIFELRDLPGMLRDIGKLKTLRGRRQLLSRPVKSSANFLLSYQMGWKPLISDLRKLLDFQSHVDKKMRELDQLYNKGGLQRRVRSPQWTQVISSSEADLPLESVISSAIRARRDRITQVERWATVRWYPADRPSLAYSNRDLAKLARKLAFGYRLSTKQLWDAIPWTWLIGWFSNVDDFIQAHDNGVPLIHSVPCVMTHSRTNWSWARTDTLTEVKGGNSFVTYETKSRVISSGTLSASIPFLGARQLSILGALAIQRFKR